MPIACGPCPAESFNELIAAFDAVNKTRQNEDLMSSEVFSVLHNTLYELKLIFKYKWMAWHKGWKNLNDADFNCSTCSMLDISISLTAIFRSDRFNDGTIQHYLRNDTLYKIFRRLNAIANGD